MNRKLSIVALLVTILVGASILSFLPGKGTDVVSDMTPRPMADDYYGDYYVNAGDEEYLKDEEWNMYGNIYVYGTLHISNMKINWGGDEDGEFGLYVYSGGALYIDDGCNFTAIDTTTYQNREKIISSNTYTLESWGIHWKFQIRGKARVNNSYFGYLWGETGGYITDHEGGILLANNDILIYNCRIQYSECAGIAIFNPDLDDYNSQGSGFSPRVDKVWIDNTTRYGIFVGGDKSAPSITNSTIMGAPVQGITYFCGADGLLEDTTVSLCDDGLEFDPVVNPYGYTANLVVNRGHFDGNYGRGYLPGRGGTITFRNCSFNNNKEEGVILQYTIGNGIQTVNIFDSEIIGNGIDGVSTLDATIQATLNNVDITGNGRHGIWLPTGSTSSPTMINCNINGNSGYGLYSNGSYGVANDCEIFDNVLGNVYIVNGSMISVLGCDVHSSGYGIIVLSSDPTVRGNQIYGNVVGMDVRGTSVPILDKNTYSSNNKGLYIESANLLVEGNIFIANKEGIIVNGGGLTEFLDLKMQDSTMEAIHAQNGANITIKDSEFTNNALCVSLNGGSAVRAYSCGITKDKVRNLDFSSEFWHFWNVAVNAHDNQTLFPISNANLIVYSVNGEVLLNKKTFFDGGASGDVMEYYLKGSQLLDFSPVNITVSKAGYIPYWGGYEPLDHDFYVEVNMSVNFPPLFPDSWEYSPDETHRNRPTLRWNASSDWNQDIINYRINVYQDELYSANHVVVDAVVKAPEYTFTRNLRYNKEYFVEVESYDPWGMNDTKVFSFRTTNTRPTTPVLVFEKSPVSSSDDIVIIRVVNSTDLDEDPVDDISYLVEWEVFRSGSWVPVSSGIDAFVLSSNKTSEGDRIRARVKAFDGIEYGQEVSLEVLVLNFAPVVVKEGVDLTINEDEIALNLVSLDEFFWDPDGDELTYSVFFQRHVLAEVEPVSNNLTLTPLPDWVGVDYILVEALDGKHSSEDLPKLRIDITVRGINDAPVISLINDKPVRPGVPVTVQFQQGSWAVLRLSASDADEIYGDDFTFSTDFRQVVGEDVVKEEDLQFQTSTGAFSVFLTNELVGEHLFNITVTDEAGASTSGLVHLIVENINEAPTKPKFMSPEVDALEVDEGEKVTFVISEADDPDLHIPDSKEKVYYDWSFGELDTDLQEKWFPNAGTTVEHQFINTGTYTIKVRARDSLGLMAVEEKVITVTVNKPEYRPPVGVVEKPFLQEYGIFIILALVALLVLVLLVFMFTRREPLADVAEKQEKEHEELVAKQQQDALAAQEKLQALLGGVAMAGATGPALPPSGGEGGELQALPAATGPVEVPGPSPEPVPVPDSVPFQAPPAPEPMPVEGAAPEPVVGQVPHVDVPSGADQTYLPPPEQ